MKYLYLLFCALPMLVWNHSAASPYVQQDTLRRDTIRITPYFAETPVNALGNFAVVNKDRYAFQNYAAFSVLNTLRGHVPNLNISPNADVTSAGLRSGSSMLVIDGLPFTGGFSSYYNLNSFEYENIYAVSSGNAAFAYGGLASDGAVFLQSKTGKNIFRPSVEFNSSASFAQKETMGLSTFPESWQFTSAIAYAQDYGAADLRVSYNGSYFPPAGTSTETERGINNVRINTGVDVADRFHARLILDGARFRTTTKLQNLMIGEGESEALITNLQGNLMLQYQPTDWLSITSQSSLAGIDGETEAKSPRSSFFSNSVQENRRSFVNLMARARQSLSEKLLLREFAGVQYDRQKIFRSETESSGSSVTEAWDKSKYNSNALLAGIGLQYDKFLFADLNYRSEQFSAFPKTDTKPAYAITTAFVFSEAFHWQNKWLSSGKLRGSYGKTNVGYGQAYPRSIAISSGGMIPNPFVFAPMKKRMVEAGADLSFFDHRMSLNVSHFHDLNNQTLSIVAIPDVGGFVNTTVDLGQMHIKGWETVLAGSAIKASHLSLYTTLTWATFKNYIPEPKTKIGQAGNPNPDWTGAVLNQLSIRNFFGTFLVDIRKGGDIYTYDLNSYEITTYDGTNVTLRDLTVGYRWPDDLAVRTQISLSARNLWTIYARHHQNNEQLFYGSIQRTSICASVTVSF